MNLYLLVDCSDVALGNLLSIIKNIVNIIWIVGPILAIVSLAINLSLMVKDPDDKKVPKKIKNSLLALVFLFLVPTIISAFMIMMGDSNTFSACWNKEYTFSGNAEFKEIDGEKELKPITGTNYELGDPDVDDILSGNYIDITDTSCGDLEYCNKFLSVMVNNSKKFSAAIKSGRPFVDYNWKTAKSTWAEAIRDAQNGKKVTTTCVVPAAWGMTEVMGERTVLNSVGYGGFQGYNSKKKITQYTKQYKFDGSMSVKTAIQKGMIQPGDIIGVKAHTFAIYSVDKAKGTAVVFDGGHSFTTTCGDYDCSPMFTYSAKRNASMPLYQIVRWVK